MSFDAGGLDASVDLEAGPEAGQQDAITALDSSAAEAGGEGGAACLGDLSNIGAADFHISFTLTTDAGAMPVVNQRATCNFGMFWDVRMRQAGGRAGRGRRVGSAMVSCLPDLGPSSAAPSCTSRRPPC